MTGYAVEVACADGSTALDFWTVEEYLRAGGMGALRNVAAFSGGSVTGVGLHRCTEAAS